jgi:hypothetical protein
MRIRIVSTVCLLFVSLAAGRAGAASIWGAYSGRYQCREWNTVDLQITELGNGRISGVFTFPLQPGGGFGSYSLTGQYDERSGRFQLTPQRWVGTPPEGYNMVGMSGRFDPTTRRLTGKMDNLFCFGFELAGEGSAPLAPLPAGAPTVQRDFAADPVQNGIEYWDATMSAPAGTPRESQPIDDVIDWLHREKYSCLGSQRVGWDPSGTKGTVSGRVDTRARFVVECEGNCRGLRYAPWTQAQVYQFGRSQPVPVMELKGLWFGGTVVRWVFTRSAGGKPPEVYIHQWSATGFDSGPGCKAPRSDTRETAGSDSAGNPPEGRVRRPSARGASNSTPGNK